MLVLSKQVNSSFTIKKSKFLCFGYFVRNKEEIKERIAEIKKDYPDASHICYAYILDEKTFYYTDGGEPSGTAGKPIYGVLKALQLNYTLFVVVRYFGGIKFGPGPLHATFKDISIKTLANACTKVACVVDLVKIQIPYDRIKQITSIFKNSIYEQKFTNECCFMWVAGDKDKLIHKLSIMKLKILDIKENQVV